MHLETMREEKSKEDVLFVRACTWKGSKARGIFAGFKLYCHGVDMRRNGVGMILKKEYTKNGIEVISLGD